MRGDVYPTSEMIARVLVLAAAHMDELSRWVLADEAVLRGDLDLNSRYVALAALVAMYPAVLADVLGLYVGSTDALGDLAAARRQGWWDEQRVEQVMVQALGADLPQILANNGAALCAEVALRGLLRDRFRIIHRSVGHAG